MFGANVEVIQWCFDVWRSKESKQIYPKRNPVRVGLDIHHVHNSDSLDGCKYHQIIILQQ